MERDEINAWRDRLLEVLAEDSMDLAAGDFFLDGLELETLMEVLAFRLGKETFAFDIRTVSEILRPRIITKVPRSPDFILGVLSLRGIVLPVTDTAKRLGIGEFDPQRSQRIIVVNDGQELMGFAVDAVVGVMRFSEADIENSQYAENVDKSFLVGIGYDVKKQLVALLDTEKLCDFSLE